jgi:hypothetical protein
VRILIREMSIKRDKKSYKSGSHVSDSSGSDSLIKPTLRGEEEVLTATECSEESAKVTGRAEKSMKVPMLVSKERFDTASNKTRLIDSDTPKCVLPEHYFDALAHRHSTSAEGEDARQLLSIETWDGRKIVSWDAPE